MLRPPRRRASPFCPRQACKRSGNTRLHAGFRPCCGHDRRRPIYWVRSIWESNNHLYSAPFQSCFPARNSGIARLADMTEDQIRAELDAVYRSTSWRVTAPLRFVGALVKHRTSPAFRPRERVRRLLGRIVRHPAIRKIGSAVLRAFPSWRAPMQRIARKFASAPAPTSLGPSGLPSAQSEAVLSAQAKHILAQLRQAHRNSTRNANR